MNVNVKALVLNVAAAGDADRLCVLLTDRFGVVRAYAKGAQRIKNRNFSATMQFVYGNYQLFEHKDRFVIDESEYEELHLPLRDDIEKLALAQYLCELAMELAPPDSGGKNYLNLMRMALYYLSKGLRPYPLIKVATEMRMLSLAGYQPDLTMCQGCGKYEPESSFLMMRSAQLRCSECGKLSGEPYAVLPLAALAAMRYIVYTEPRRVFSFELAEQPLKQLAAAGEQYLLNNTEHSFVTLDFYKALNSDR